MAPNTPIQLQVARLRRRISHALIRLTVGATVRQAAGHLPTTGIHRIMVAHISHTLGNSVLLTPLLQELERVYPGAEIDIVSRSPVATQLYGHYPCVSRILCLPGSAFAHLPTLWRLWRQMRRTAYDLAIDTDPQSQTGRLWLIGARARHSVGFCGPRKRLGLTHPVPVAEAPLRKGQQGVYLLRQTLGPSASTAPYPLPDIRLEEAELARGRTMLAQVTARHGGHGGIGLFANATGRKRLDRSWWQTMLQHVPGPAQHGPLVEIVPASGQSLLDDRYPAFYSTDLRRLAAVLAALDGLITGDCGVMHLACASGVPVLVLFVDTRPEEWGPYGPLDAILQAQHDNPAKAASSLAQILQSRVQQSPASEHTDPWPVRASAQMAISRGAS